MPPPKPPRGPVPADAIAYLEAKGIRQGFSYQDVWAEEHDTNFTVAKVMSNDVLSDVQKSLIRALEEGQTFDSWSKDVQPMLDRSGWGAYGVGRTTPARLSIIYQTNLRAARAVGQWERIQRTKEARPFLRYALGPSERHRPLHVSWDGTTLPVDDPWWGDHTPQLGFGCLCHLIQESRIQTERRGGPTDRPIEEFESFKNPRTGRIERVPKGVDPGFAHRPGQASRAKSLAKLENESTAQRKNTKPKV